MRSRRTYTKLGVLALLSMGLVVVLFVLSEKEVHRNNAFTRRYPPHPMLRQYDLSLGFNSYYLAGHSGNFLYLGNATAPLHLLRVNLTTKDTLHINLKPIEKDLPLQAVDIRILPPYFFMAQGTAPYILRGELGEWIPRPWMQGEAYFSKAIPSDTGILHIRTIDSRTQESVLGLLEKREGFQVNLHPGLLEKQIDGIFDVDGAMVASSTGGATGYVYYYRNEFLVMDSRLNLLTRQQTIDTVRTAQIRVARLSRSQASTMGAPPLLVNKMAALFGDWMMIGTDRLGRNEDRNMLKEANIVDVYNWKKGTYQFSFYLYHIEKEKAREFGVYGKYMAALIGDQLSVYTVREDILQQSGAGIGSGQEIKETTGR